MKKLELPDYLTKKQKTDIRWAYKNDMTVYITGNEACATGKSYLKKLLESQGVKAVERWECVEIRLDTPIQVKKGGEQSDCM